MYMFVSLRTRTEFSLLNSTLRIDVISEYAKTSGMKAVGMMDDATLSGALQFATTMAKSGIKPIIGCNIGLCNDLKDIPQGLTAPYIGLIAKSQRGYSNILKLLWETEQNCQKNDINSKYILLEQLNSDNMLDVICITGGYRGILAQKFLLQSEVDATITLEKLQEIFQDRLYIELTRHGNKHELEVENFLLKLANNYNVPLVATNDCHFLKKESYDAYDILTCIASGKYVQEKNRAILNENYYLKSPEEMEELFSDIPEAINNTIEIAKRCNFYPEGGKPLLPSFVSESGRAEFDELDYVSRIGLDERITSSGITQDQAGRYQDRLEFELNIIKEMGFAGYFLIVSDFIKWAKRNNIPVGPGRGSGVGSIIAWSTQITNVDPLKYGLLFERFLNPERVSMPDFDIDFCQAKRELVIDYVKNRYGSDRVASIITFGKLQAKAVLKDVGRVMQLSYGMVDELCKMIPFSPLEPITIQKAIQMDPKLQEQIEFDPDIQNLVRIGMELEGLNRHHSTHAAGIIIGDRSLIELAPLIKDENSDLPVLALNMKDAEKIGLLKFDFLGLKTLTVIQQACELIKIHRKIQLDIDKIPLDDKVTFELLRSTKLRGIFQLEAGVPREALSQMKTDKIEDLIAITSLNRPGPMDNIPDYVRRKLGQAKVEYPHPLLESVLQETYGIIIYQEQVMEVAKVLAGYSLGGADLLRRAMGKKIKEEMDQQRQIFVDGCKSNGINEKQASEIFDLVEKFAGYGFNKSHAAAYSVISYQTAYLKANYAIEFFVANLNLEINDTDKINEFISDARSFGIDVVLPNVNTSEGYFSISEDGKSIFYGLGALKAVGINSALEIARIRKEKGNFTDVFDFAKKVGHKICNKKHLESLISTGSFDMLHKNRRQLVESIDLIIKYSAQMEKELTGSQDNLFGGAGGVDESYQMKLKEIEDYSNQDKLAREFEYIGFYLSEHPLSQYQEAIKNSSVFSSCDLENITPGGKKTLQMVGVITKITQRFRKSGRFCFLSLSDLDGIYEVAVFNSDIINEARDLLVEGKLVWVDVSASRDDAGLRLIANKIHNINKLANESNNVNTIQKHYANLMTHSDNKTHTIIKNPLPKQNETPPVPKSHDSSGNGKIKTVSILCNNSAQARQLIAQIKAAISQNPDAVSIKIICQGLQITMPDKYDITNLPLTKI